MSFNLEMKDTPCPTCGRGEHVWEWGGMTYNLAPMFRLAGFYNAIKRPFLDFLEAMDSKKSEDSEVINKGVLVKDIVELVRKGLEDMIANPAMYKKLNPSNKWGNYDDALKFVRKLLEACIDYPNAVVYYSG